MARKKRRTRALVGAMLGILFCSPVFAGAEPLAWWRFDEAKGNITAESVHSSSARITGNFEFVAGIKGSALKCDGFTTQVVYPAKAVPSPGREFTIEAWVALGAYPWNWAPILSQADFGKKGYYFGIDSQGRFGLCVAAGGKWIVCRSEIPPQRKKTVGPKVDLDLRKWYHVAAVYQQGSGIRIYRNGIEVNSVSFIKPLDYDANLDIVIGRNRKKMAPTHPVRTWATYPSWYSFDGIIDEIKLYDTALTGRELAEHFNSAGPAKKPDIPERHFPTVPSTGRFGAYYTKLKYYKQWDALWPVSDYADIVVQFDLLPVKVMFWRGSRYSPCWVSENGKWMADQSREVGENWNLKKGSSADMPTGCCEHMSDAQCRFSRVKIIENHDARVVVEWRYALVDVLYRQARVNPVTGWGLWGDELYTIYPDGVAVRSVLPGKGGWQETIFFSEPGTTPEDNCELEAITLVNLEGRSKTYSWEKGYPKFDLPDPVIQMTNLKSKFRPFLIFRPGSRMSVFNVEVRPEYSHFPWWNHWPVAQIHSDGRHAQAADRAAHSSLVWGGPKGGAALYGMTDIPAVSLVPLARSWNYPPKLKIKSSGFSGGEYDYKQRAYLIKATEGPATLEFELAASDTSPVVNPAFVIENWGDHDAALKINGRVIKRGRSFRLGHRKSLQGTDLVIWIEKQSTAALNIQLLPPRP